MLCIKNSLVSVYAIGTRSAGAKGVSNGGKQRFSPHCHTPGSLHSRGMLPLLAVSHAPPACIRHRRRQAPVPLESPAFPPAKVISSILQLPWFSERIVRSNAVSLPFFGRGPSTPALRQSAYVYLLRTGTIRIRCFTFVGEELLNLPR